MTQSTKDILKRVETWPQEDQEELAEIVRDIEARRSGVYHATSEALEAIDEALGQVARGESPNEDEIKSFWQRSGVATEEKVEAAFRA